MVKNIVIASNVTLQYKRGIIFVKFTLGELNQIYMKLSKSIAPALLLLSLFVSGFVLAPNGDKIIKSSNEGKKINWLTIEEAEKLTKENPRKIFVDVYTDWCGWCKKMDASTFADEEVIDYVNENYYAVKLDAESQDNISLKGINTTGSELARSFRVSSYPTIVFIDENFHNITPVPGFRKAKEFHSILKQFNGEEE